MLKKTQGIVINYIKYRESSIISRIFTREFGLKAYIINGIRSPKAKSKIALYQPLTLLDLVAYEKEGVSLNRISEAKLTKAFQRIPFDFYRSGIAIFVVEILGKVIHENYQNEYLFDFLQQSIGSLDEENCNLGIYPLTFLVQISRFLGFEPENATDFFAQLPEQTATPWFKEKRDYLENLIVEPFDFQEKIPVAIRRALLDDILLFYTIHLDTFRDIKSIQVLRKLMG